GLDSRIVRRPFRSMVEGAVVVGAVPVVLAVGLVVFVLVRRHVVGGEAIVRGDEVDRGDRTANAVRLRVREEVGAACKTCRKLGCRRVLTVTGVRGARLKPDRAHIVTE